MAPAPPPIHMLRIQLGHFRQVLGAVVLPYGHGKFELRFLLGYSPSQASEGLSLGSPLLALLGAYLACFCRWFARGLQVKSAKVMEGAQIFQVVVLSFL